MALVSPGVEVQVVDESAYGAPGAGTSPLIILATRENKTDPTGGAADGIAKYTKSALAGEVVRVTSQREVTQFFGNPIFSVDSSDNVIQGSETSEYGLMAAYSYLGQGNTAYIVRADVDLAQLDSTTVEPVATWSTAGTHWLDTDASTYGIHEYDATLDVWRYKVPTVEVIAAVAGTIPQATVVTGGYHVVVSTVDKTIEYYVEDSGSWVAPSATLAPHYSTPTGVAGAVWIKTTSPGNGIDLVVYEYQTTGWTQRLVQGTGTGSIIGGYVPQNGSSTTALTATTATENKLLLQEGTDLITVATIDGNEAPASITDFKASIGFPTMTAEDGQVWFDDTINGLDMYVVTGGEFVPVTPTYGVNAPSNPTGGDVWINTLQADTNQVNERAYPDIRVYNAGLTTWVQHNNTDQTTNRGVIFDNITDTAADTSNSGAATTLADAPDALVYADGMIAVNMGQSKNTVREYNATAGAWRSAVENHADGSGRFGRYAQRAYIAAKMQAVASGEDLREPQHTFTLLAAPNYPELTDELVNINSDRGETGFIIIDTPMRKNPTQAINWIQNVDIASENGEDGLVTNDTYSAVYYPSGAGTEPVNGKTVVLPPSHMALYTYAYNDNVSFQWFAPAGLTRGVVQNASSVGYITSEGEFKAVALTQGQRDAMYSNKLNPITTFIGQGTVVFGQKTMHQFDSALDRVNVARLVAYLRERFDHIARPFLFEINDQQTRDRAKLVFERFLADILSRRGIYDFAVVCDETNNTPARIDRNELYIDVAIEPAKVAEFIYIPIRIVNTGTLSAQI